MSAPGVGSRVTRYVNGIGTVADNNILADFGMPDPTKWITYFDDFMKYAAGDWTITNAGSQGTAALTDILGGALLLTNNGSDDSLIAFQTKEMFLLSATKKAFFKARFKVSDATQSDLVFGLQVTDTTPLDVVDGIYFLKSDGAATVNILCRKDASTGSNSVSAIATLANDTFVELAWYYDGAGTLYYAVDGVVKGSLVASSAYLPDQEIGMSFALQNGEAVAKNMTIDYVFAALER